MGADTKGLIIGTPAVEEIAAIVREHGAGSAEIHPNGEDAAYITFPDVTRAGTRRTMSVMWGINDYRDVYSGERTRVSLGAFGASVAVIEAIVSHYGGFVLDDDSGPGDWRAVERRPEVSVVLTPLDELSIELARELGPKEAEFVRGVATDPARLDAMMAALGRYRDAIARDADVPGRAA